MNELLTSIEMASADRLAIKSGTPGAVLMENAGRAVARVALRILRGAGRICVVSGPGNNGGDGLVAARLLAEHGLSVHVALLGDGDRLGGDAAGAAERYLGSVGPISAAPIEECDLVIDAMFGAGLSKPVDGLAGEVIARIEASGASVVAVDVPSGIDGTTGNVRGRAVRADHTVTFFRAKPGHLLLPGRIHCGVLHIEDIGIDASVLDDTDVQTWSNDPMLWRAALPAAQPDGHKYDRGHVIAVSGGPWNTGAIRLAATAALRVGAGLVTVAAPSDALSVHAAHLTAIMLVACDNANMLHGILADKRKNVAIIGPASGTDEVICEKVMAALEAGPDMVLDADALTAFEANPAPLFAAIAKRSSAVVITPHEGEFARLFPEIAVGGSKLERARSAAARCGAHVVLKGGDTVVAAPDGRASINANAPAWLATAGAGDVLSGLIAGLLAQAMPAFEAASAAVWLHGAAAHHAGQGLIAEDIPQFVGRALGEVGRRRRA